MLLKTETKACKINPLNAKLANSPSPPPFSKLPPLYWFFVNPRPLPPSLKSRIFQWSTQKLKFFILNTILSFTSK